MTAENAAKPAMTVSRHLRCLSFILGRPAWGSHVALGEEGLNDSEVRAGEASSLAL